MTSKYFFYNVIGWLIAVPMGLHLFGFNFGAESVGQLLSPLVLQYQNTSAGIWVEILGDGAKGPREHMFLTFTALVFTPSLLFLVSKIFKFRNSGIPVIQSGTDLAWFGLNCIGTFVLSNALLQKYLYAATSLVLIFLIATFLIRYAVLPGGSELFFQRFTPPKRQGENDLLGRASPWMFLALVVAQLQTTITEFPKVDEGRWLYVVCIAFQFWIIILSTILKNRLPAKVFMICLGIFLFSWIDQNIIESIRAFSIKWGIT